MKSICESLIKRVKLNIKVVFCILLSLVSLTITHIAHSDEKEFRLGSNILMKESRPFDVVFNSVGYKVDSFSILKNRTDIGYWSDKNKDRKDSLFISNGFGIQPEYKNINAELYSSLAYISNPDSRLSTNFQFKHDIGIHYKMTDEYKVGIIYTHISNGGIKHPNLGRDFIGLGITLY